MEVVVTVRSRVTNISALVHFTVRAGIDLMSQKQEPLSLPIKFYAASSLIYAPVVKNVVEQLENKGFKCAFDWTAFVDSKKNVSKQEIRAIAKSDFLIFFTGATRGCNIEFGASLMAKELGKNIKVIRVPFEYFASSEVLPNIPFYEESDSVVDLNALSAFNDYAPDGSELNDGLVNYLVFEMLSHYAQDLTFLRNKICEIRANELAKDSEFGLGLSKASIQKSLDPVVQFLRDYITLAIQNKVLNEDSLSVPKFMAYLKT